MKDLKELIKEVERLNKPRIPFDNIDNCERHKLQGIKQTVETFDSIQLRVMLSLEELKEFQRLRILLGMGWRK